MQTNRKIITVIAATAALAIGGGIAFAAWTATGEGSGQATAGEAVVLVITPAAGPADLYPGVDDGDLFFTITNDNTYPVTFTEMTAGPGAITSTDEAGCPGADNVAVAPNAPVNFTVGPGETTGILSIEDVVSMSPDAADECQGESFDIPITLTGTSQTPAP